MTSECVDNNYLKDTCHLPTIILHLSSEKIVQKKIRKCFQSSRSRSRKTCSIGEDPRHFEAEHSIISLPLLEASDARIRNLLAQNDELRASNVIKDLELAQKRAEVFQLTQELQLLREEVARSRLAVDPVKNTVKFNASRKSYWDVDKSARSVKRKKLKKYFQNTADILPAEFKPVEVVVIQNMLSNAGSQNPISIHCLCDFLCYRHK